MLRKLRITVICMLVLILAFSLASCKGSRRSDDNTSSSSTSYIPEDLAGSITISGYSNSESDNDLFFFAQAFALQYPSVDVQIDNGYSYNEYIETLDERMMSGDMGDVILLPSSKVAEYAEKNWILDLSNDSYGVIDYTATSYKRLYPSEIFMEAAYNSSVYDGKFYMCPVEYLNQVVILNLDMLSSAGIENPVPADNWTWDDLLTYAEALKENGIETPILMNYSDYSVWGAFARGFGGELYSDVDFAAKSTELNFTDPDVIEGLKYLADNFLRTGYVSEQKTIDVSADELSKYGIIVAEHSDLVRWESVLSKTPENGGFDWEFAHFPGFVNEDGTVYKSIGVETLGFAVVNHDVVDALSGETSNIEMTEEEQKEAEEAMANTIKNAKTLALYAMVEDAAVNYCGDAGYKVPALKSANTMKFWREFPFSGKNTSVFSLYADYDYPAILTTFMTWSASGEITDSISEIFRTYAADTSLVHIDDMIQQIQDAANASR